MSKICQKITKSLPVTFAWLTLLTCTGLVYGFVMPYIIQTYGSWILICEGVVFTFVVCNFTLSTFMDPGRYPKANEVKDSNAPMYKNVEIDNVAVSLKWCRTCKMYRPPRCTHCNECNSCIEVFDHHCPWVNNCIGRRNYRYFFQFLWLLIVHMMSLFVILVVFVWQHRQNVGSRENVVSLCVSVVIGLLCWPISGLAVFHVMLVSRGRTTNEQVTGKAKSLGDVYDQGCCRNWKQSFCGPIWPRLVDRVNTSARVEEFPKSARDATVVRYKAKEMKVSKAPSSREHLYSKMLVQPGRFSTATASVVDKFSAVSAFRPGIETGYPSVDKSCRGRGGLLPDRLQNFCGRKVVLVRSSSHQSTATNVIPPQVTTNSNLQDKISSIINTLSPSKKSTSKEYESIRSGPAVASSPISEGSPVESSAGETSSPCEAFHGLMVEAEEEEEVVERTRSSSRHKHSSVTNILNLESCKEPSDGRQVVTNRKRTSLSNMICRQSRNIQPEDESCLKSLLTEESNNPSTPGSGSTKRRSFILSLFKGDAVGDKPPDEVRGYDNLDFDAGHLNVDLSLFEKSPTLSARSASNTNNSNNGNTLADEKTKEFHDSLLEGDFSEDATNSENQDRCHGNQQTKKAQQLSLLSSIFKPSGSQGSSYSRINPFYKVNPSYAFRPTSIAFGRSPVDPVPLLPSGVLPQVGNPAKLPGDNPVILTSSYYGSNADSFQPEASLPRLESRDGNPQENMKSNKNFDNIHRNPDFRPRQLASFQLPEGAHEGAIKRPTSFLKAVKESDYLPPPCGKHFYTPQETVAQTTDQRFHRNHSTSLGSLPNIIPKSGDKLGDSKPTTDAVRAPMASLSEEDFNSQVNLSSFEISV